MRLHLRVPRRYSWTPTRSQYSTRTIAEKRSDGSRWGSTLVALS